MKKDINPSRRRFLRNLGIVTAGASVGACKPGATTDSDKPLQDGKMTYRTNPLPLRPPPRQESPRPEPDRCAVAALYHDASEILTGDLPTPIKYYNPSIKDAYKQVERIAGNRLLDMLPPALRESYEHLILEDDQELEPFVKAADKLSAYIKCVEEQKAGNTEFDSAAAVTMEALKAMHREEMDWFLENCLPPFSLNLDQL